MGEDTREGLTAVISIKIPNPQFEGQTKTKLGNSEVEGLVSSSTFEALTHFFEETPAVANKIIDKIITASRAREAARKAKELTRRKGALAKVTLFRRSASGRRAPAPCPRISSSPASALTPRVCTPLMPDTIKIGGIM